MSFIKNEICGYRTNTEIGGKVGGNTFHSEIVTQNYIEVTEERGGKKLYEHCV